MRSHHCAAHPRGRQVKQSNDLLLVGVRCALASTCLPHGKWGWTKLQINQPLTYQRAQVKQIIEGKPPTPPAARQVSVDADSAGQRLDNFLLRQLKGVPKTHVYRIIRSGEVRVNKGRASADTRVQAGDVVRLPPLRVSEKMADKALHPAPAREFALLLDDEHMLAIDKPAGVAVHGGSGVSMTFLLACQAPTTSAR